MTNSTVQPGMRAALASPHTPIAVINGTPVYPLQGGRSGGGGISIAVGPDDGRDPDLDEDDDEDDEEDDEDLRDEEDDDAEDDDDPKARKRTGRKADDDTPGAIRRMEEALSRANKTAARHRRAGKAMEKLGIEDLPTWLTERGIDPDTGLPFGDDVVDPGDDGQDDELFDDDRTRDNPRKRDRETARTVRAAAERAKAEARDEMLPIMAQLAATNALREAGFNGSATRMERILRLVDPRELDFDVSDGEFEIEGLDEQIANIRDEFPELFDEVEDRPRKRTVNGDRRASTGASGRQPARRASGARDVDGGSTGRGRGKATGGWLETMNRQIERGQR